MNYIKHLTGFFNRIALENTLNPTHISLYITIFQCWNVNRFKNPITITRDEMMKGSKIASNATYHKCIKDLQRLGYLDYNPSFNPYSGTSITVHNFSEGYKSKSDDNALTCSKNESTRSKNDRSSSKNEQPIGQATEQVNGQLYIENKKTYKNNINNIERTPEFEILDDNLILENQEKNQNKKSCAKKEKAKTITSNEVQNPTLELTKEYFKFQEYSEFEAERFFNYYSSNGWLIGGKTKMKDWKAAARNWMMNTNKFNAKMPQNIPVKEQTRAYNLHTETEKNYAEPL
ncbi:MAG: transcriptional regulator [Paludibacter sp.]|nr:transcriptional regulator [Paludibacter sp.]